MPVHKVTKNGKVGYQWGKHGKIYYGPNAEQKAKNQAKAIYASGYNKKK